MFGSFFKKRAIKEQAFSLYRALVTQARNPAFYTEYGIADSIEGRFDAILLHLFLVDNWLAAKGDDTKELRRLVQEAMVSDMDRSFREMGVGDMSVGKEMKKVVAAWLGRRRAYAEAIVQEDNNALLVEALKKNIFGEEDHEGIAKLADYIRAAIICLEKKSEGLSPAFPNPATL